MKSVINNELTHSELKAKVEFYENIITKLPALIYINEIEQNGDISSIKNIWANKCALDFIGYSQDDITNMGTDFAKIVTHPDDLKLAPQPLDYHKNNKDDIYIRVSRYRPKNQNEYQWIYSRTLNFNSNSDKFPQQSLNVAFELNFELHTSKQWINLFKENSRSEHYLKLKSLTKRENEVMKFISEGLTDNEIGNKLCISIATAKTHRNRILKKLKLKNSASLAALAVECGL